MNFFGEHIGFVLPRLKDLLSSVNVSSKADLEFHVNHRTLRFLGEVQTEVYLEAFSKWLSILFECGQRDASASSLLAVHTYEIIEHLLANLDECLLAKVIAAEENGEADLERWILVFQSCFEQSDCVAHSREDSNLTATVSVGLHGPLTHWST